MQTKNETRIGWLALSMAILGGLPVLGADAVMGDGVLDVVFPDYAERAGGVAAYDSARNRLVRFGGYGYPQGWPLTSEWDGQKWIPVETAEIPPAPAGCQMVYDVARSNVVLFGGYMAAAETWLYNGTAWTNARPAHTPSARTLHQMVYDSARQRVVLFGGSQDDGVTNALGDTWEWDGADWQQMAPAVSPVPRKGHQMTFDAARGVTVLYKGQYCGFLVPGFGVWFTLNEQWTYDGTTWSTNGSPTTFPSDSGPLVFNPARGVVELFGGFGSGNYTLWTFNGTNWSSKTFNTSPPSGGQLTDLDYVSSTGTAVYVWSAANARDRTKAPHTWAWNGANWTCRNPYEPVSFVSAPAWADVNGDGHPDRVVCGNILSTNDGVTAYGKALFLHDGTNLCLTPAWLKRDSVSVTRVALGDVTGDGRPEAVFSSDGTQKIQLYAYTGGTFAATATWQSDSNYDVAEVQLVDVDGDKDLDLVALRQQSGQAAILVFTNGAGSLGTAPAYAYSLPQLPGGSNVNAIVDASLRGGNMAWADIDHDGKPECAVGYYYPLGAGYHIGVVDFTGTNGVEVLRLGNVQAPVAFADVDGDGYPDLIGTARSFGPALFHNTDGVIGGTASWVASYYGAVAVDMAVGDFDGDGDPDLVTSHHDNGQTSLGHLLYRNDGGAFGAYPDWRSHEGVGTDAQAGESVDLLDFDGDGVRDVVADRGVYLLDRVPRDTVPPRPPRYAIGTAAPPGTNTVALQWDASPDADVAAYRIYRGIVSSGTGNRFIAEVPGTQTSYLYADPAGGFDQYWIYAVDAAGNEGGWATTELIGSLPAERTLGDGRPDFSLSGSIMVADVTGDGLPDLFTARSHQTSLLTDYSWALLKKTPTSYSNVWERRWGSSAPGSAKLLQDATGDGRADLLVSTWRSVDIGGGSNEVRLVLDLWPSTGSGFDTNPVLTVVLPTNIYSVGTSLWGDPDGDGDKDLALATYGAARKAALFLNTAGKFASVPDWTSVESNVEVIAFGNLNGDGKDDLACGEDINNGGGVGTSLKLTVYKGTAGGLTASPFWKDDSPANGFNGFPLAVSWDDFDRDGDSDLTLFSPFAAYAYRNSGGTLPFSPPFSYSLLVVQGGSLGSKPAHNLTGWANINGSGALDLYGRNSVISDVGSLSGQVNDDNYNSWSNRVTFSQFGLKDAIDYPWRMQWSAQIASVLMLARDLNGDGVADLIFDEANLVFFGNAGWFPPTLRAKPTELIVTPANPLLLDGPGATLPLTVLAVFPNGVTNNVTSEAIFDVDNPADGLEVVHMRSNVVVAANGASSGRCRLTVQWTFLRKVLDVYVGEKPHAVQALRLVPGTATLTRPGEPLVLTAVATLSGGVEADVTPLTAIGSLNPASITTTGNVAIAVANGVANVVGTYAGLSATTRVTVALSVGMTGLTVSPTEAALEVGARQAFEVRAHYGDGSSEAVTFLSALASRNAGVAAVQGNAAVAVAPGLTDVTATYGGRSANAGIAVNGVGAGWIELLGLNLAAGQVALDWYATPALGLTNLFTVYARTNLVDGTWEPVSPALLGHPSGFMSWAGGAASNTPVFYRIGTSPR